MEITINGNVTINNGIEDVKDTKNAQAVQNEIQNETVNQETIDVNHDEDVLLDNSTSFFGLLDFLRNCPDAVKAEKNSKDDFKKEKRRPGAVQLWKNYHRIASKEIGADGKLDVYSNGYAVCNNGNRRTVIWVPDCGYVTYYFGFVKLIV